MSYPEPRYHDDTGEVSATYRAADHAPEVVYPNGNTVHYLATGEATHGLFGLYRWEFGTGGQRPGPALPPDADRVVLRPDWHGPHLRRQALDRHAARRLRPRARGRNPRLQERVGCAGVDAHPLLAGRATRGLLRGSRRIRPLGPAGPRGARRVLPHARQRLAEGVAAKGGGHDGVGTMVQSGTVK